jgi:hypothetical protein
MEAEMMAQIVKVKNTGVKTPEPQLT